LRSTLARIKGELELAADDGRVGSEVLLADLREALEHLARAEESVHRSATRVLVLDDDERLAEITARGLRRLGFEAEASSRWRPLSAREVLVFDLSLLSSLDDVSLQAVKAARPVVLTGATDSKSRSLAARLEASDYLVKPVEPEALASAVNRRMSETN
jgi:DNA-binding NtrC family response regulator